jgi:hypothetical protein
MSLLRSNRLRRRVNREFSMALGISSLAEFRECPVNGEVLG